jgi:hypothetical protein
MRKFYLKKMKMMPDMETIEVIIHTMKEKKGTDNGMAGSL